MKVIFAFAAILAVALAAPQGADKDGVVVKSGLDNIGTDGFNYGYEASNGKAAQEQGEGQFKYVGPDGVKYRVSYDANENGFAS